MGEVFLNNYIKMSLNERMQLSYEILNIIKDEFEIANSGYESQVPIFKHLKTDLEFVYVPRGNYNMGLSANEENYARKLCDPIPANLEEMRPVKRVTVKPFLVTRTPILYNYVVGKVEIAPVDKSNKFYPAFLERSQVELLESKLNLRLPKEEEWEYMCRAGTTTLFSFGDELPDDNELEGWLSNDFSDINILNSNRLGIYGLYTGEWCKEKFKWNYDENAIIDNESYCIRGGGSFFWPWQDNEWVWCMSAMRMPSKDLYDGTCGFRLVYDLSKDFPY